MFGFFYLSKRVFFPQGSIMWLCGFVVRGLISFIAKLMNQDLFSDCHVVGGCSLLMLL